MLKRLGWDCELNERYERQIEVLLSDVSDVEKVHRFGDAAGFNSHEVKGALARLSLFNYSVASALWYYGSAPWSLFSTVPGLCSCPVALKHLGVLEDDVPMHIGHDWEPTREELTVFKQVQLRERANVERTMEEQADTGDSDGDVQLRLFV